MDETAVVEKVLEYKTLFDEFNQGGSVLTITGPADEPDLSSKGMVDSYTVTRAAGDTFWLLIKEIYYDDPLTQPHKVHTIKVESWEQEDGWELDLVDDLDRRFHIELLFPKQDVQDYPSWQVWFRYKSRNRKRFRQVDRDILAAHMEAAAAW